MNEKNQKNISLSEKVNAAWVGGHSNLKIDISATPMKIFVERAKGSWVHDVDGNEYVDFLGAMGPTILGHCHEKYVRDLKNLLDTMSPIMGSSVLAIEQEIALAEKLKRHIPCAEEVKLVMTGSEAVQLAMRLARAYTGKRYVIRFSGHYHGWFDNVLGQVGAKDSVGMPFGVESEEDIFASGGRDPEAMKQTLILPWNDIEAVERCLEEYADHVAMVHCEPIVINHYGLMPKPGFLKKLKSLCEKYNVVLSFDEVITGFRCGLGGAQEKFGVTPHMATFAKAMGGGIPIAMVAGKKEIMQQLADRTVLGPGTFNGYALGIAASLSTLEILEENNGAHYVEMARLQDKLAKGIKELSAELGYPVHCQGVTGALAILPGVTCEVAYTDEDLMSLDEEMLIGLWQGLQDEGVLTRIPATFYLSIAHTEADIDFTLQGFRRCLTKLLANR